MYGIIEHGTTRGFVATLREPTREIIKHGSGGPSTITVGGFKRAQRCATKRAARVYLVRHGAERVIDETDGTERVVYGAK